MPIDHLSLTFAALADPTRRTILSRLAEGEATVNELAEPLPMSLPAISRHLKVLERAGLIVRGREAQWRPSRLQAEPLDEAMEWMQARKRTWEGRMDRLDAPIEAVSRAWPVPAELAAWYGPAQFDTPEETIRIDLRVGGRYELTMVR